LAAWLRPSRTASTASTSAPMTRLIWPASWSVPPAMSTFTAGLPPRSASRLPSTRSQGVCCSFSLISAASPPTTRPHEEMSMTAAEPTREQAVQADQNRPNPPQIQGRVDAIENDRIYGWVWDAANTGDRLAVQVLVDGRRVATVVADRPRIDLRRNGIGDGAYSFDIPLPPEARASPDGVTVVAVSPSDGSQTVLRRPTADERAAEAAIATPIDRKSTR